MHDKESSFSGTYKTQVYPEGYKKFYLVRLPESVYMTLRMLGDRKLCSVICKDIIFDPGEGNGNLPQCSCLENPRDRGAWWAAIYGVAQSRTRLKQLSSSSSSNLWRNTVGHILFSWSQYKQVCNFYLLCLKCFTLLHCQWECKFV